MTIKRVFCSLALLPAMTLAADGVPAPATDAALIVAPYTAPPSETSALRVFEVQRKLYAPTSVMRYPLACTSPRNPSNNAKAAGGACSAPALMEPTFSAFFQSVASQSFNADDPL